MDSSPHLRAHSSRTVSPEIFEIDGDRTIIIGTSADDEEMRYSPLRQAPLNTHAKDSFSSYSGRPPPSSPTDTTPITAFEKRDTLPVLQEYTRSKAHVQNMLAPRTPPRSAQRSLNALGPSPSRALSLPMTPTRRSVLTEGSGDSLKTPHRATVAMAKHSAAKNSSARKVAPLTLSTATGPSNPRSATKKKGSTAVGQDEDYGADDEAAASIESPQANPLAATQSMPDLRESPQHRFPLSFFPGLIESRKRALKPPPPVESSPTRSIAETDDSSISQEYRYYSRYMPQPDRPTSRPLTQKPSGLNPPGIIVHSQSQSDHAYSHSSGDYHATVEGDYPGPGERIGTTLVAGTPSSESSGSSQPEHELDLSQLYREGRSFIHVATQDELVPTQVVMHSKDVETLPVNDMYPATQSVDGDAEVNNRVQTAPATRYPPGGSKPFQLATQLLATQSLTTPVDLSPHKSKGFFSSSSGAGSSIPGLSVPETQTALSQLPQNATASPPKSNPLYSRPEYTPSKHAPVSIYRPENPASPDRRTPTRPNRPKTLASRPQDSNIPERELPTNIHPMLPFRTLESTEKALKKPFPAPAVYGAPKKNGLSRRKSPAPAVDQWLAEREALLRTDETAPTTDVCQDEETAPVEDLIPIQPLPLKKPIYASTAKKTLLRRKSPAPAVNQWLLEREVHASTLKASGANVREEGTAPAEDPFVHVQTHGPKRSAPVTRPATNGLSRRKSPPPAVDRWLVEREVQMRAVDAAPANLSQDEETASAEDSLLLARDRFALGEEMQELPLYSRPKGYTLVGVSEIMMAGGANAVLSSSDSAVMVSDEERLGEAESDTAVLAPSLWTNSPEMESPAEHTTKPNISNLRKGNMFPFAGLLLKRTESIHEPTHVRTTSTGTKHSNVTTVSAKTPTKWREDDEESSSADSDHSDYKPQETQIQTQEDIFETQVPIEEQEEEMVDDDEEDEEIRELFPSTSRHGAKKKRDAKVQGGRKAKRVCRRTLSPKVPFVPPLPKVLLRSRRAAVAPSENDTQKAMPPPIDTSMTNHPAGPPSNRATRATHLRCRTKSKAAAAPQEVGHLVLVRYSDAKRFFLGYAVSRAGKLWEIAPCDGSPTTYSELKNMRDGVLRVDDLVTVSANSGGEDCGDAIVIAVDQHWDEDRTVKVRIGGEEERYVAIRYLSVQERHIDLWNDRRVTHKDLENEDGMESMAAPTSTLHRSTSFAVPTPAKAFAPSTIRTPQTPAGKIFSGVGFILTMCEPTMTKRLSNCGGYIYDTWLSAFKFDGSFEKVRGNQERWIRHIPGISHSKKKGRTNDSPTVQWIGNEHEQGVKTLFVVAGKVIMTAKILIALAFGIPCVSNKWIKACEDAGERVDWIPYLLPSHNLPSPFALFEDTRPAQAPDYQWGSDKHWGTPVLDDIMNHEPLAHRKILYDKQRVLYIAPGCIEKLARDYDPHLDSPPCQVAFVYCCLAMGAQHVEAVEQHNHATDKTLLKYDLIVVADSLQQDMKEKIKQHKELSTALTAAQESGIIVINQADFKMSMACGKLLKIA